ncbi:MAG TPA: hypothetical protein H9795_01425 [Candidatus Fournierella merdigallinarum]|nr:hypothetical protein [Candidatus Fournierella merdigallinarum]
MTLHEKRYLNLISYLDDTRKADSYYSAACFLLAGTSGTFRAAVEHIGVDNGAFIDFAAIRRQIKKNAGSRDEILLTDIAFSLFACGKTSSVTPRDMAELPSELLELVAVALFVASGKARVLFDEREMTVDFSRHRENKAWNRMAGGEDIEFNII